MNRKNLSHVGRFALAFLLGLPLFSASASEANKFYGPPIQPSWIKGQTPPTMYYGSAKYNGDTVTANRTQASLANLAPDDYTTTFSVPATAEYGGVTAAASFTVYPETERPVTEYEWVAFESANLHSAFDTGVKFNHKTTKIEYKYEKTDDRYGMYLSASDDGDTLKYSYRLFLYDNDGFVLCQPNYNNVKLAESADAKADRGARVFVSTGTGVTYGGKTTNYSKTMSDVTTTDTLWIGTGDYGSGKCRSPYYGIGHKFYYLKMWSGNGETLIHHWVPVRTSSNATMLYDKVTKQLLPPFTVADSTLELGGTATPMNEGVPTLTAPADEANVAILNSVHKEFYAKSMANRVEAASHEGWSAASGNYSTAGKYRLKLVREGTPHPVQTTFSWTGTGPFRFEIRRAADQSLFFATNGLAETSITVDNFESGTEYIWAVGNTSGFSAWRAFTTEAAGPRLLRGCSEYGYEDGWGKKTKTPPTYEAVTNLTPHGVRDLGGYVGLGGRRVRQGLAIRSSEFDCEKGNETYAAGTSFITAKNSAFWRDFLGIKTDVDLRNTSETSIRVSPLADATHPVAWKNFTSFPKNMYDLTNKTYKATNKTNLKNALKLFADPANYPFAFHCVHGKDRTGCLAYMLLGLLGVSQDDIHKDYEGTLFWNPYQSDANLVSLDTYIMNNADASPGTTLQERIASFVKNIGVTDSEIAAIRNIMLEPLPVVAQPVIVAPLDNATVSTKTPFLRDFIASANAIKASTYGTASTAARSQYEAEYCTNCLPVRLAWSGPVGTCAVKVYRAYDSKLVFETQSATGEAFFCDPEIGRNYRWTVTSGDYTAEGHFFVAREAPRIIGEDTVKPLGNACVGNARDLGGWTTSDGKVVRQGLVYRTRQFDWLRPDPATTRYWAETIGIKLDLDLRKLVDEIDKSIAEYGGSRTQSPLSDLIPRYTPEFEGLTTYQFKTDGTSITDKNARIAFYHVFKQFLNDANYPIVFHCSHGKDRTGQLATIILGYLGVPLDSIKRDYCCSWMYKASWTLSSLQPDTLVTALNSRYASTASTLADQCAAYIKECAKDAGAMITDAQLDDFKEKMLETPETPGVIPTPTEKDVWAVLGDSYSTWGGLAYVTNSYYPLFDVTAKSQLWWSQVIAHFNGEEGRIVAGGGSRISGDCIADGTCPMGSFENRAKNGELGTPNHIMILGGLNDYWAEPAISDATLYTKMESLCTMLDAQYAKARKIVLLTKLPSVGISSVYRSALKQSAVNHGYTVVDLEGAYSTSGDIDKYGHPNASGMTKIANRVIDTLEERYTPPTHVHQYGNWVTNAVPTETTDGQRTGTCVADGCAYPLATTVETLPKTGAVPVEPFVSLVTDGKGYLVTDYKLMPMTHIEMKFQLMSEQTADNQSFFWLDDAAGGAEWGCTQWGKGGSISYYYNAPGDYCVPVVANLSDTEHTHVIRVGGTTVQFDNNDPVTGEVSLPMLPNTNIMLFASRTWKSGHAVQYPAKLKLYSFKIWEGDTTGDPVRNYVAATNAQGKATLYDTVTKTFLNPPTTGTFAVSNDPEPAAHVHQWSAWTTNAVPNCTTAGEMSRTCSTAGCTETPQVEALPALDHAWGDWTVTKEPTMTAAGEKTRKCGRCTATETQEIPMLGLPRYLQTDGKGYFDLGFVPHLRNTRIEIVSTIDPDQAGGQGIIWAGSTKAMGLCAYPDDTHFTYYVTEQGTTGEGDGVSCGDSCFIGDKSIHTLSLCGNAFGVDGKETACGFETADAAADGNAILFLNEYQAEPAVKLYSVKVWDVSKTPETLVHSFVPSTTAATLFDEVTQQDLAVQQMPEASAFSFSVGTDAVIAMPEATTSFEYDNTAKRPIADGANYTLSGDLSKTAPGTYTAWVRPNGGCCWADGTHDARPVEWTITGAWNPVATAFGVSNKVTIAGQDYCILSFTNTAAAGFGWTVPAGVTRFDFLVAAGGGGGGAGNGKSDYCRTAGGGGAGGVVTGVVANATGTFTVKVGAGGARGATLGENGKNGGDSSLTFGDVNYVTARGGGYGGGARYGSTSSTGNAGGAGGSGGGGSASKEAAGAGGAKVNADVGSGVTVYQSFGNAGGSGYGKRYAGGGGGAGGAGESASSANPKNGAGGAGLVSGISGDSLTYGCGGGTGCYGAANDGAAAATSTGNGGRGGYGDGDGVGYYGEAGGSGVVVIRYAVAEGPLPPHVHLYGDWRIETEPTLEAAGEKRRYCTCGDYESAVLPKLVQWVEVPAGFTVSNTIICLGDSLTQGDYADALTIPPTPNYYDGRMDGVPDTDNYPYRLAKSVPTNYNVIAQAKNAKATDAIVSWFGGIPMKTSRKFTLPATTDVVQIPTNILYNGTDGGTQYDYYLEWYGFNTAIRHYGLATPYLPLSEPVEDGKRDGLTGWLGGVHVRLGGDYATDRTIWRTEAGDAVEIPAGATFVPDAQLTYKDAVKVIYAGTNDEKENADKFLQQIADALEWTGSERYIVVSSHNMAEDDARTVATESVWEQKFREKFGDRYLNLRLAMVTNGVATAHKLGFSGVTQWYAQGATGLICTADWTHYNTQGYAVVAQFVKEKLQTLGYLPADPEPVLDYCDYLQTDGKGWLDLGFRPHLRNTRVEVVSTVDANTANANALAWAHSDETATNYYRMGYAFWPGGDNHFSYYVSTGTEKEKDYGSNLFVPADKAGVHTVCFGGTDFVVDGVRTPVATQPDDHLSGDTMQMFVSRPGNYQNSPSVKVYSVKVWDIDGTATNLVHHFVPVRVGAGASLCDVLDASKTVLAVQGTGANFTGGDDTTIAAPTVTAEFEYDGTEKRFPLADTDDYTVLGDLAATIPGTYVARVVPNGGRCWDGGSHEVREISWTITGAWKPEPTAYGYSNRITIAGQDYCILSFTNTAAAGFGWTVPAGVTNFDFLVVAGGGGGGAGMGGHASYVRTAGGGGAGGVVTGRVENAAGAFTVKVGAGGARGAALGSNGSNGGDSSLTLGDVNYVTAKGGGYGGGARYAKTTDTGNAGGAGGSGGGGSSRDNNKTHAGGTTVAAVVGSGVTASEAFGNAGGAGYSKSYAGGGGGACGAGESASATNKKNGAGGAGLALSISGVPATYACGGGTSCYGAKDDGAAAATATGNGGRGGHGSSNGDGYYGEAGGSGIVIIRYAVGSEEPVEEKIQKQVAAAKSGDSVLPSGVTVDDVELAADGASFTYGDRVYEKAHYVFEKKGGTLVAAIAPAEAAITSIEASASDDAFVVGAVNPSVVGFYYAVKYADAPGASEGDWTVGAFADGNGGPLSLSAPKAGDRRFYRIVVTDVKQSE